MNGGRVVDECAHPWRYIGVIRRPVEGPTRYPQSVHRGETGRDLQRYGFVHRIHSPYGYHEMSTKKTSHSSAVWMTRRRDHT
jgi:hypothetical protein